jgi:predicted nucleic acid-binding protein
LNLFLDTSAVVKLYNSEKETEELTSYISQPEMEQILISEIAKIEFRSALWKKFREKQLEETDLNEVVDIFSSDTFYKIIPLSEVVIKTAIELIGQYGRKGLRTLDSIQMASILIAKSKNADLTVITFDSVLKEVVSLEGIKTL